MKNILFLILLSSCFIRKPEVRFVKDGNILHGYYTRTLFNNKLVIQYNKKLIYIDLDSIYPFSSKQY